jgi:dTDP-glucose 4,6-dehydratase
VARVFSVIGPGLSLDSHYAAGNLIRDALAGGPLRLTGDGTAVRSYLYLSELAFWLWTILIDGRPGRAYNVGGLEAVSVLELAERIAARLNNPPAITVAGPPGTGLPNRQVPDVSRARTELGLSQRIGLDEAIDRTLAWHRAEARRQSPPPA